MKAISIEEILEQREEELEENLDVISLIRKHILSDDIFKYTPPPPRSDFDYHYFRSRNNNVRHISIFVMKNFYGGIKSIRVDINNFNKELVYSETIHGDAEKKKIMEIINNGKNIIQNKLLAWKRYSTLILKSSRKIIEKFAVSFPRFMKSITCSW